MADDNKKVNATITMVFKSGAVMCHLVNGDATVAKGCIDNLALVINLMM